MTLSVGSPSASGVTRLSYTHRQRRLFGGAVLSLSDMDTAYIILAYFLGGFAIGFAVSRLRRKWEGRVRHEGRNHSP